MALRLMTVVGARPQFVKAAAVSRAVAARDDITEIMVHTGQHFDDNMSKVFFDELDIPPPAFGLDIHGGSHGDMTGRMLGVLEAVMRQERPDWVMVYGDTNTTLAGALGAAKLNIPVAHVEAGLRSFNRRMPEEINRVVADHLSTLLFCPTVQSVKNLEREGITSGVHHVGDVMFDATMFAAARARERSTILDDLRLAPGGYALATIHRAENTDDPEQLRTVMDWLSDKAKERAIVFPVHPRTRDALARAGIVPQGVAMIDPVGYLDMARLLDGAVAVYTDSGGLQKEAYFHRKPCVTLRSETEWTELVACGWNRLWIGPDYGPRGDVTEYGEGDAAGRILDDIARHDVGTARPHS
jgi:UDP-GlcNAc3NAcA epimerase